MTSLVERDRPVNVFSHSGLFGDLIYALPTVRALGGGRLMLFPSAATDYLMTPERAQSIGELVRRQPYVHGVTWQGGPTGVNLDAWRGHYQDHLNLSDMVCEVFGVPHSPREQPWLFVEPRRTARIVLHRSARYRNPNFPWRRVWEEYRREAIFVGLPKEHAEFCDTVGPISYIHTEDMYELARLIAGGELFVGNQSSPFAVAEGLKVPTVLEIDPKCNNCHWDRRGNVHGWDADVRLPATLHLTERFVDSVVARASGHTLITEDRLATIARAVRETAGLSGDMAELGVGNGGSAKVIASMAPEKTLHLFDTFRGIPEDDEIPGGHKQGEFAAEIKHLRAYLEGWRVTYNVGAFPHTAGNLPPNAQFSFVHLDADTYQSTLAGIDYFWPRLVPGGVLVLDDYEWSGCPGVTRAASERLPLVNIQRGRQQAWLRKA